jgi:hypothetical protein
MHRWLLLTALIACSSQAPAPASAPPDPMAFTALDGARVHFVSPQDGATVTSPVEVVFGLEGAEVKPAGELVPGTGHHHLIINRTSIATGEAIPADDVHIHYGKGQTRASLDLEPGEYTLTMQFADGLHRSYGPTASATARVTVTAPSAAE